MATRFNVEVVDLDTDDIIKSITCYSEKEADTVEKGVNRNLNHFQYYTQISKVEKDD